LFVRPFLLLICPLFPLTFYILSYFYLPCQLLFYEIIYNLLLIHSFSSWLKVIKVIFYFVSDHYLNFLLTRFNKLYIRCLLML